VEVLSPVRSPTAYERHYNGRMMSLHNVSSEPSGLGPSQAPGSTTVQHFVASRLSVPNPLISPAELEGVTFRAFVKAKSFMRSHPSSLRTWRNSLVDGLDDVEGRQKRIGSSRSIRTGPGQRAEALLLRLAARRLCSNSEQRPVEGGSMRSTGCGGSDP
jgi:hypothetical protein